MTPQQVAQTLRHLHAAYGNEVTEDMGRLWSNVFAGDEAELVRDATDQWIRERTQFPTPADLRQVMRQIMQREDPQYEIAPASTIRVTGRDGGWKIAYKAYCDTVTKAGQTPKPYDEFIGLLPEGKS